MARDKHEKLVVACHHILNSFKAGEKAKVNEVMKEVFACNLCTDNEPKTEKEFMEMFVTVCKNCIRKTIK